jgi:hypothetical protein
VARGRNNGTYKKKYSSWADNLGNISAIFIWKIW